jgi:uncharacterized protein YbjT (DUF2867 family)
MTYSMTGATGYIGESVAERLRREGHALSGLARTVASAQELLAPSMPPVAGTFDDAQIISRASCLIQSQFSFTYS